KERSKQFGRMADARAFKVEIERELIRGTYVDPRAGDITFKDYAEQWRTERADHRATTAKRAESLLRLYAYPHLSDLRIGAARKSDLKQFVRALVMTPQRRAGTHAIDASRQISASMVHRVINVVKAVFSAAAEDGRIASNPCQGLWLPELERVEIEIPTTDQLVEIVAGFKASYYQRLVLAAAGTGLRSGELRGLTEDRVNFLRRTVKVDRQLIGAPNRQPIWGPPKSKAGYRTIPVAQSIIDVFAAQIAERGVGPGGLIFTGRDHQPVIDSTLHHRLEEVLDPLGWPEQTGLHVFRHYYASLLIHAGLSVKVVQKRLGHATAQETLDTYGHLWPDDEEDSRTAVQEVLGPIVGGVSTSPSQVRESVSGP
ncbi:MAG: tyrosine-type recombinase/integrase, partial [Mycobacterium sp.]